jgi:hypothetical protein
VRLCSLDEGGALGGRRLPAVEAAARLARVRVVLRAGLGAGVGAWDWAWAWGSGAAAHQRLARATQQHAQTGGNRRTRHALGEGKQRHEVSHELPREARGVTHLGRRRARVGARVRVRGGKGGFGVVTRQGQRRTRRVRVRARVRARVTH